MGVAGGHGPVIEDIDVMDEQYFDVIEPQPFERMLERAHDAVVSIVVGFAPRRSIEELADAGAFTRRADAQQPADLGRDDIGLPRLAAQEMIEPGFGKSQPIEGRGIIVADAGGPGRLECRLGLLLAHRPVEIAEGSGAETQLGEADGRAGWRLEQVILHVRRSRMLNMLVPE